MAAGYEATVDRLVDLTVADGATLPASWPLSPVGQGRFANRVYGVSLGGFDTHAKGRDTHARLLGQVDEAVTGFFTGLEGSPGGVAG